MTAGEYLKILDSKRGVSGNEESVREIVKELFNKYCDEVRCDKLGNVIGKKCGFDKSSPSVMIEAHIDEIGLMVRGITDSGMLKFITVGGFDPKILTGTEVTVHGKKELFGVIGAVPPHLLTDRSNSPTISELCVDIGFSSKEDAQEYVSIGDIITINTDFTELLNDFASGRCIDDRGGIAIIMRTMELLSNQKIANDIYFVATVQEEVGLRGAKVSAEGINPDIAIALDVCHGTSSGVSEDAFPCGKGPVITIGPNLHRKLTDKMIKLAEENEISLQKEVCSGNTGTDAWEIQVSGDGVKTALLSVPLRYMHANYEVCSLADLESAARLISMLMISVKDGDCLCW